MTTCLSVTHLAPPHAVSDPCVSASPPPCVATGLRTALVESESNECPECHQTDVSPDNIIPNRFIRKRVVKFE